MRITVPCVGVQTALRRPAAGPRPNNPDPRPFIKFSEDPASESPLSSLTLVLTRELEEGQGTEALLWHYTPDTTTTMEPAPSARSPSYLTCQAAGCRLRHRTYSPYRPVT